MANKDDARVPSGCSTVDVSALHALVNRKVIKPSGGPTRPLAAPPLADGSCVKVLLQPDAHYPFHDKRACELLLRVAERTKPDVLVVLGDHFDFYAVSDHRKDPLRKLNLEAEIASGDEGLRAYERLGVFKRLVFCEGNHEERLSRFVADKGSDVLRALAPAGLLQTRSLPEALDLKSRGWEWIPYKEYGRIGSLHFTHDVERAGKTAHEHAQQDFETSSVIGHTHRLSLMVRGNHLGQWRTGAMLGWLGDWRQVDYRHKMKIRREWPLGFGMAYIEKQTDITHLQPILIHSERRRYRALVEGRVFVA